MATKKTTAPKTSRKTPKAAKKTVKKATRTAEVRNNVKPYIRRILSYINPETQDWKNRWNAQSVASKLGLTKMQVAAVLAHYVMGTYSSNN